MRRFLTQQPEGVWHLLNYQSIALVPHLAEIALWNESFLYDQD